MLSLRGFRFKVPKEVTVHRGYYSSSTVHRGSDQNAKYALSKLLQMGTVAEYEKAGRTKSPLSADTFGNSGVDESETSGPETPAKEVVDNANGSALICLVGYGTGSRVVIGLPEEFREGNMVDALSRVLEQKSSENGVDSDSERRDYELFGASLFAFLNPGPVFLLIEEYGIPESISLQDNILRGGCE
nr:hypothetical protein [Tanacetum cinerariifolium]